MAKKVSELIREGENESILLPGNIRLAVTATGIEMPAPVRKQRWYIRWPTALWCHRGQRQK